MSKNQTELHSALSLIRSIADYPKPGIVFKDITPLLSDASAFAAVIKTMAHSEKPWTHVAGIEARGFIIGSAIALQSHAGFVPLRKAGKLPFDTHARSYALEYATATLEIHQDAFGSDNQKNFTLLVDDVLATGGTILAALDLIHDAGGTIGEVRVLLEIAALDGRSKISERYPNLRLSSLVQI